ncbi:MAG TPA: ABC transporter permease [Bacteroidia bacterium]|nr:ABC transporter permease [Bacteroidia bacterium]
MKTLITSSDRSNLDIRELQRFAGLFRYLSLRDVIVRYKQTRMGFAWSVLRPLINIVIFGSLSVLIDRGEDVGDKFLHVSAAVIIWQLISTCITDLSNSLLSNANILTKVYFPKVLLPLSGLLVCLVDFAIAFVIFLLVFILLKGLPPLSMLLFPLVLAYALFFSFSIGLLFSTASVKYRDVKFIVPFLLQILFYASPVFISSEFVLRYNLPDILKGLYQLNPLVHIINAFKYCFFGAFESFSPAYFSASVLISLFLFYGALRYFLRFEKTFADHI